LLAAYNPSFNKHEVILANSDRTLSILDLTQMVVQGFSKEVGHTGKIESILYSKMIDRESGSPLNPSCVLTASEDKSIKIWDRQSGKVSMKMSYMN
jgi:WD40 repeat protein